MVFRGKLGATPQPVESLPSRASGSTDKVVRLECWNSGILEYWDLASGSYIQYSNTSCSIAPSPQLEPSLEKLIFFIHMS
jgi:hypothetical protein